MKSIILLIEDFVTWRIKECKTDRDAIPPIPGIKIYNHLNEPCGLDFEPRETTMPVEVQEGSGDCADPPYVMQISGPVYPKRLPLIEFDAETENHLDVTISGNLRPFETCLDALGVPKKRLKQHEYDQYGELFYALHDKDITDEDYEDLLLKKLIPDGFQNVPVAATCKKEMSGACKEVTDKFFALDYVHRF